LQGLAGEQFTSKYLTMLFFFETPIDFDLLLLYHFVVQMQMYHFLKMPKKYIASSLFSCVIHKP